uniref:Methionyl-tRNA formyltransferase, mitochondrial n=2 Tax=Lotharella globosa TaxID=91324 RepID=A0A7S3YVH5_9EUKA
MSSMVGRGGRLQGKRSKMPVLSSLLNMPRVSHSRSLGSSRYPPCRRMFNVWRASVSSSGSTPSSGTEDKTSQISSESSNSRRVIFMGTPEFAAVALRELLDSHHEVVAVYSQPPRPAGRGRKLRKSPCQILAEERGIPVYTPKSLRKPDAQAEFSALEADVAAVAAYGLLLPKPILEDKLMGCINIHPSLLPRWRGAAPIPWAIIDGDEQTGVCIMQLDEGMDTGPVLARRVYDLEPGTTAGELHDSLADVGAKMLVDVLDQYETITPMTQEPESEATHARKIVREDGRLDFSKPAVEVLNRIHGLSPIPGAYFELDGVTYKVLKATVDSVAGAHEKDAGTVVDENLTIVCGDGKCIRPELIQKQGKRAMTAKDFLCGNKIQPGTQLKWMITS